MVTALSRRGVSQADYRAAVPFLPVEEGDARRVADGDVVAGEGEAAGLAVHPEDGDVVTALVAAVEEPPGRVGVEAPRVAEGPDVGEERLGVSGRLRPQHALHEGRSPGQGDGRFDKCASGLAASSHDKAACLVAGEGQPILPVESGAGQAARTTEGVKGERKRSRGEGGSRTVGA